MQRVRGYIVRLGPHKHLEVCAGCAKVMYPRHSVIAVWRGRPRLCAECGEWF